MMNEVAERYAEGLMELAVENGTVEEKKDQAEFMLEVMQENPEVELFFRAVKVTKDEKHDFIDKTAGRTADHYMVCFLKLMVDKGRIYYLSDTLKAYVHLADEKLGIQHAVVESARKLSEDDLRRIASTLEKKYKKKFVLKNKIDPKLIAGMRIIMDNHVVDASMAKKIEDLRNTLLKGGQA